MNTTPIKCPMCRNSFYPVATQGTCQSFPTRKGCQMVCCPVCGYETVDLNKSTLARAALNWMSWVKDRKISPRENGGLGK